MPLPVVRHEDAPHVRVSLEVDTEHVENFTLIPVGRRPDLGHGRRHRFFTMQRHLDPDVAGVIVRHQVVDQGEIVPRPRVACALVNRGQVFQATIFFGCLGFQKTENICDRFRISPERRHISAACILAHNFAKTVMQGLAQVRC